MSGTVDTRTVEMRFDNQDFEKNCRQSMSTLEKLKTALKLDGASKGLSDIEKASKKLDMKDLQNSVETVGNKFSILETIATGVFLRIGMAAADAGIKIVKSLTIDQLAAGWSKYEEKTTAVQTIMANLRDDAEKFTDDISKMDYVNEQIEKLNWFSDETSYSLTDMTSNIGKFVANGQDLEDSVTAMEGIATWAAISGQNSQTAARAMYNISQAMGTGAMKIKDWMSIENANMATAEFKETAIAIAQEKGKIKEGQVTIENFRESLSAKETNGWFDKEVMMATFEEYGSAVDKVRGKIEQVEKETGMEITASKAIQMLQKEDAEFAKSLGFRAFAAAQEAKTLGEAISATADAVSTKWMQIFELIFGNYLQQKELWTDLANDLWDVFAAPLDRIKSILQVWNEGFGGESGRTHLIDGLKNIFNTLIHDTDESVSLLGVLKESFLSVFGLDKSAGELGKQLFNLTKKFKDFTERMKPSEETIAKFRSAFEGFFTVIKNVKNLIGSIIKPFASLFGKIFGVISKELLNSSAKLGEWVKSFDAFLEQNRVFERISNFITSSFERIGNAINFLSESLTGMSIGELASLIKATFIEKLSAFIEGIKAFFSKDTEGLTDGAKGFQNFLGILQNVFETVKTVFSGLADPVGKVFAVLGDVFKSGAKVFSDALEKEGFFGLLKTAAKVGVALLIGKFLLSLIQSLSLAKKAGWVLEELEGIFRQVKGVLKALKFQLYSEGIKNIAVAVALLSLAVAALGSMDKSKLARGLAALLVIVGIIALLKTVVEGITGFGGIGVAAALLGFAVAVDLLVLGVGILGSMNSSTLTKGLIAVATLVAIFGIFKTFCTTVTGIDLIAAAAAFALFGAAVDILALGVIALGLMSAENLAKGLIAVATLVAIFGIFKTFCTTVFGIDLIAAAAAFALFGLAVDILALGVIALGSMPAENLAKGLITVAALVAMFGIFKTFCITATGIDLIAATAAFGLFGAAIDILAIGVVALGQLELNQILNGITAVAAMVTLFEIINVLSESSSVISIGGFLAFAAGIVAISLSLNMLIPVMQTISGMGDSWWQPLVFLAAALALVLASGAIAGIPLVAAGLTVLSGACLLVGIAVGVAAAGLGVLSWGFADLVEALAKYGPEAAAHVEEMINAMLITIINAAPLLGQAAVVLIAALAYGLIGSANILAAAAFALLSSLLDIFIVSIPTLADKIVALIGAALHTIADAIRGAADIILPAIMDILSAILELVLEIVAQLVETIPGVGPKIAGKIREWKDDVNEALTGVFDDAGKIGTEGAEAVVDGFSGGGSGKSFAEAGEEKGKELTDAFNEEMSNASTTTTKDATKDFLDEMMSTIDTNGVDVNASFADVMAQMGLDINSLTLGGDMDTKMGDLLSVIGSDGTDINSSFYDVMAQMGIDVNSLTLGGDMETKMGEVTSAIDSEADAAGEAASNVTSSVESEMTSMNSYSWGSDLGAKFASGISSKTAMVRSAALALANAVSAVLHFSEPDEGPLSNFHTFAPDMVKLWNKGIYDNLGSVESSSESMANTIYDGFSTALDYVSDLIDDGMSDELTIRPIMDLSEIQNGISSLNGMIGSADGYSLSGTARLASSAAYSMSGRATTTTDTTAAVPVAPVNNYNTFNITNNDPSAVAQKVSKLLDQDTRRAQAVWARR